MVNYFAPLPEGVASASLHLMRMLIRPGRYPEPHITVRYAAPPGLRSTPTLYDGVRGNITLEFPTTFEPLGQGASALGSLIVQCWSPRFESLQYKDDFFDTFLHVTLFHGEPSELARSAYDVVTKYPWRLRFKTESTITSKLSKYGWPQSVDGGRFGDAVRSLSTRLGIENAPIGELPEAHRLELIDQLCEILHTSTDVASSPHGAVSVAHGTRRAPAAIQDALWLGAESKGPRRSAAELQREGVVQTPPEIAQQMAQAALRYHDATPIDFGDPATGTGNLYAWVERLAGAKRVRSAIGIEMDEERSQATARRWARSPLEVVEADFVEWTPDRPDRSLVLANPPYVPYRREGRWADRAEAIADLAHRWGLPSLGRANLYVAFVLKVHDWMREGAVASWLLPDALIFGDSTSILRRYLVRSVSLKSLHWFPADVMPISGVRSNFVIVTYRKEPPKSSDVVECTRGDSPSHSIMAGSVPLDRLAASDDLGWSRVIEGALAPRASDRVASGSEVVASFFNVRRGVATGDNSIMVLSDDDFRRLGSPFPFVSPVVPRARNLVGQVVGDSSEGEAASGRRWLIDVKDWQLESLEEFPAFAAYLRSHYERLSQRLLVSRRRDVFSVGRSPLSRFLFLSMAPLDYERSRFFFNKLGGVALNNYLLLHPRTEGGSSLSADGAARVFDLLLEIDYSPAVYGRALAGNLVKFEPRDLGRVPVPAELAERFRGVGLG